MINGTNKIIGPGSFGPRQLPLRELSKPRGDEVHLWHIDFDRLSNPLSPDGKVAYSGLSMRQHRAFRRFYLRLLLGAYMGLPGKDVQITRRIKGKPELDLAQSRGELDFSVSRSQCCYLVGISSGAAIGVDLELAERRSVRPLALARRYFSQEETAALSALDEQQLPGAFMRTWACKEAIVKASGHGIANQLCRFTVEVNPHTPPAVLNMRDDDHAQWGLALAVPAKGAIAAVAVRNPGVKLLGFSLS